MLQVIDEESLLVLKDDKNFFERRRTSVISQANLNKLKIPVAIFSTFLLAIFIFYFVHFFFGEQIQAKIRSQQQLNFLNSNSKFHEMEESSTNNQRSNFPSISQFNRDFFLSMVIV